MIDSREGLSIPALFLTLFMIFFIGLRPISSVFADMQGYYWAMVDHRFEGAQLSLSGNYLFVSLMSFMSSINTPPQIAIIILAFINFFFTFIAVRKLFPEDQFASMLIFFSSFSTFAYATNGLKAGCAAAFFLCALAYKDNWKLALLFLACSLGFHHSQEITIVSFIICLFIRNHKFYFAIWCVSFVIALLHITYFQGLFANITDDHGAGYLLNEHLEEGTGSFRFDFILYSSVPIFLRFFMFKGEYALSKEYDFIYNVYLLSNSVWLMCMYASFTNRFAFLSWGIYPVVLIYPFLKLENNEWRNKRFSFVLLGNLAFTLFMSFIYYKR